MVFSIIIVTYNPTDVLIKNTDMFVSSNHVGTVYVIDNSADNNRYVEEIKKYKGKVCVIENGKNLGIAKAQNIGLSASIREGYDWAVTFDQDSVVSNKLLDKYSSFIDNSNNENIAVVNTDYYDSGTKKKAFNNSKPLYVNEVLSSGSAIRLSTLKKIGFMREDFFIDQVDNEFCYRVRKNGFDIVVLPEVGFKHSMGHITEKRIGSKRFYLYNQSPVRTYYRTRNSILFYRLYNDKELEKRKKISLLKDFFKIMLEDKRAQKYKCFFKGLSDGLKDEEITKS